MSRKRRGFDIDLDSDEAPETDTNAPVSDADEPARTRRGPMATAISETAGSLRDRAVLEAQIRAENDALAHEHVRLKKLGLITGLVPLDLIDTAKLVRDRAQTADPELAGMLTSIREIGLSNPIRVEAQADGRYELVQGFRRLAAFRALLAETGDVARYGTIPATIMARGDTLERLYRQMIDENLVRKDISFAEMAQMAILYTADPDIEETEPTRVVARLFGSASYSKRSHIRSFIGVMAALGADLRFAPEIPRALGLALAERLTARPDIAQAIRAELQGLDRRTARDELDLLRRYAGQVGPDDETARREPALPPPSSVKTRSADLPAAGSGSARISFQLSGPQGPVQCIATDGRIELRLVRDFSQIGRERLQAAVQALLDRLG